MIKVRATKDGQKLYIKEISGEHNHELSEVMRYFSEGPTVMQWQVEARKFLFERQQVLLQYSSYIVHYITVIVCVTLHYVLVILYFPILYRH